MNAGTCIRLLCAMAFSVFSLLLFWNARADRRYLVSEQGATLFRLPVDLSARDAQYQYKVQHALPTGEYRLLLRIETSRTFNSREQAQRALKGAKILTLWRRMNGGQEERLLDEQRAFAYHAGEGRFFPGYDLGRIFKEKGTYSVTMKVTSPAVALKDSPQILTGSYQICGCILQALFAMMVIAFVFGIVGALLGVPVVLRFLRAQRQPAV